MSTGRLPARPANHGPGGVVGEVMQIDEQHVAEPGLVVLDIAAADEDTLRAVMKALQQQWAPPA